MVVVNKEFMESKAVPRKEKEKLKIFVLDDEIHKWPRNAIKPALAGNEVVCAMSAMHAKEIFKPVHDLLLLDHDMLGYYQDSGHPNTGYQFAAWMVQEFPDYKPKVVLHSQNNTGRSAMKQLLVKFGFIIMEFPFCEAYSGYLQKEYGHIVTHDIRDTT